MPGIAEARAENLEILAFVRKLLDSTAEYQRRLYEREKEREKSQKREEEIKAEEEKNIRRNAPGRSAIR